MTNTVKVSLRIPVGLAERMEKLIESGIYSNRSEIIKAALREYLLKEERKLEEESENRWILKTVEPILAEDWESEDDEFWDNYKGAEV